MTLLDIILIAVMVISGLLAMVRGLVREVFAIASWVIAAGVTLYAYPLVLPFAKQYIANDTFAMAASVGGVFLLTLLIVSIITVRISDMVLDSRIGALDRTLGFLFGLARGFLIMVVAFLFFNWLVQNEQGQPNWIRDARSKVVLQSAGDWLISVLPEDPEKLIRDIRSSKDAEPTEPPPEPFNPAPASPAKP
ncbi:membrane protein required for colicin V production [Angulomicrobium amanitiforme]|uniref:Membrane protein required for colicin V production n=2 Tax=Ancylobacter TaxID=99 RepID=A0A839Z3R5_9HYPH|nr:CvpA family protein [Ancylobacter tetraedralis]MBB3770259.1 membrane protein required for colicin V production [Ancylobacter tetraedralis]MDQ0510141.1 membrane protein required for colicin V production [Ancylobacter amanitiformis]